MADKLGSEKSRSVARPSDNEVSTLLKIETLDLSGVDLRRIHFEEEKVSTVSIATYVWPIFLLGLGGLVLWVPSTDYYQFSGHSGGLFFALCATATIVGLLLGRMLWRWAVLLKRNYRPRDEVLSPPKPMSAFQRRTLLLLLIGGAGVILFTVPDYSYYQSGSSYEGVWFLAAAGALLIGVVFSRWLLAQAQAKLLQAQSRYKPIALPPWFKWVSLSVLAVTALIILIFSYVYQDEGGGNDVGFSLGGVGFICGVLGAIWIAHRFDEMEQKAKRTALKATKRIDFSK